MKTQVVILKCPSYSTLRVAQTVERLFGLLGVREIIRPGSKVFLKPNLLSPTLPEEGVTTHPLLVKEVARRIKERGAKVFIGDSPGGGVNVEVVYEKTGMNKLAKELGVELIKFDKIRKVKNYPLAEIVFTCDYFISLPKFKTHSLMVLTGGIKNSFGLVPGTYKTELHLKFPRCKDFSLVLVDVFSLRKPDLVIVDAVVSMAGEGPTGGVLRNTGLILGSADAVALDATLARLMGIDPLKVDTLREAFLRGLGEVDEGKIEVLGESLSSVSLKDFPLPRQNLINLIPSPLLKVFGSFIKNYPLIDNSLCEKCFICIKSCPVEAIGFKKDKLRIDYHFCIKCLCCYEFCPHKAIYLKKSLLLELLKLVGK
ncbi:MAG: DUF362 domain-containing protein [Candidatus Omnitrophica bacterium]|nr:DUF362 domain-containing protein [Candidatus Omnitrophota bacterium]